jgi:hypothetical protein
MIFEVKKDDEKTKYQVKLDIPIEFQQTIMYMYDSIMEEMKKRNTSNIYEKTIKNEPERELLEILEKNSMESQRIAIKAKTSLYVIYGILALNSSIFIYNLVCFLK